MTPRLLSIFCLCQLGAIGSSWLVARLIRKGFVLSDTPERMPPFIRLLAEYGWVFVLIPILCVLLIPRHREDEEAPSWRWPAVVAGSLGLVAFGGPLLALVFTLSHIRAV